MGYCVFASPQGVPAEIRGPSGKFLPSRMTHIDLGDYELVERGELNASDLEKRRNVDYCWKSVHGAIGCTGLVLGGAGLGATIAGLVKGSSNANDCQSHVASLDGVTFRFRAEGRNCDTTAEQKTIQGAIQNFIEGIHETLCGVDCIKLTHGGTWEGYVTIAAEGFDPTQFECGKSDQWTSCGSGGKYDA
ncbi:hypothetical protein K449DRAFT_434971 [Hypoxylon sp. EC38]|nr:hypothetical protein K449DRAFT_434971 [Hypoxylon sp. EC38]OTA92270.1 hypothetical protein M434DRAFT_31936 [Hypoxylon sp. CO27-5]